jgi:hypothetical protein
VLAGPNQRPAIGCWSFLALALEIVAFALGVSAWPDAYGKASVITISVITGFILLLYVLQIWM